MERQQAAKLTKTNSTSRNNVQAKLAPQKPTPLHPVLQLQRKIGNQAVHRLTSSGGVQAKLAISQPGDKYEQEADRVADQVMRMSEPTAWRKCAACAAGRPCPKCDGQKKVQTKKLPGHTPQITPKIQSSLASLRGGGQPLPVSMHKFFEARLGQDFSRVRLHTGSEAGHLNRAINAQAFTFGPDIYLGEGKNDIESSAGRRLLAHELTHVIQQTGASPLQSRKMEDASSANMDLTSKRTSAASGIDKKEKSSEDVSLPHTALLQLHKYSGQAASVIFRSESVHPEEQYCEDLSKDPTAECAGIIECIEELIEQLAGRFHQFEGDPGHLTRIIIVQGILKALMVMALSTCEEGEYDKELEEEAQKWADKKPGQQEGPATEEQKKTLRERLPSVPGWVWAAIGVVAAALIIACFASGVCEVGAILAAAGEIIGGIIIPALRLSGALL